MRRFAQAPFLLVLCLTWPVFTAIGQNKQYPFVSLQFHQGKVLNTNDFVGGDNLSGKPVERYQSLSVKIGLQNPGYQDWQKVYKSPYYGVGFFMGDFFSDEIGKPYAAYGFLGIPTIRWKMFELYTEFQYGMAWHWNHYDPLQNSKNVAIGSNITVHAAAGLNALVHVNRNFELGGGIGFTHFSNGRMERPNAGINLMAPSAELKYHFRGRPNFKIVPKAEKLARSNDFSIVLGYGNHQLTTILNDTNYFAIAGISAIYSFQHSNAYKSGVGLDLNFWWSLTARADGTQGVVGWDNLTTGIVYQPEFFIGRFTMLAGVGIYARHLEYGNFKQFYQRLGVRFHFSDHFSAGANVRSVNFYEAEFIEFQFGYHLKWKR